MKPFITKKQAARRLKWCKEHSKFTIEQWRDTLFTDESRFKLLNDCKRSQVRRRSNEKLKIDCLKPKMKFPISIMVWGGFSSKGVTPIRLVDGNLNSEKYIQILEDCVIPLYGDINDKLTFFQQDNASCHVSKRFMIV